jgi:hypothetical protein
LLQPSGWLGVWVRTQVLHPSPSPCECVATRALIYKKNPQTVLSET